MLKENPIRVIEDAVKGMLRKSAWGALSGICMFMQDHTSSQFKTKKLNFKSGNIYGSNHYRKKEEVGKSIPK